MASIRDSKKLLKQTVNHLVDEAYNVQIEMPNLKDKSDALIDRILDFHDASLAHLNDATSKKDLRGFSEEIEQQGYDLFQDIMNLHV